MTRIQTTVEFRTRATSILGRDELNQTTMHASIITTTVRH